MKKERFKFKSAVYVFLISNNRVLLLKRKNTGFEDGKYSTIAGHIDGNEEVFDAAVREAFEEAGVIIKREDLIFGSAMHRKTAEDEWCDWFFLCSKWDGDIQNREIDKCDELTWFNLDQLPNNTIPYIKKGLEDALGETKLSIFGWSYS